MEANTKQSWIFFLHKDKFSKHHMAATLFDFTDLFFWFSGNTLQMLQQILRMLRKQVLASLPINAKQYLKQNEAEWNIQQYIHVKLLNSKLLK